MSRSDKLLKGEGYPPAMDFIDVNSKTYEARYAADMRHEALVEAVARALMDQCYGPGTWDSISSRPEGVGQVHGFKMQARAAIKVVEDWNQ